MANRGISALNVLAGFSESSDNFRSTSSSQRSIQQEMLRACGDLGPCPKDPTPAGAFEELRGASLYEDPQSTVVAFNDSSVSLPEAGSCPRPLAELYGT
eukprot:2896162-Karenia_brevis.AAC.1